MLILRVSNNLKQYTRTNKYFYLIFLLQVSVQIDPNKLAVYQVVN